MDVLEIRPFTPDDAPVWERIGAGSSDAWFWHTRDWADYQWSYGHDRVRADLSFFVWNRGAPAALCPVFLESCPAPDDDHLQLALAGAPIPAPAVVDTQTERQRRDVLAAAYNHLHQLAREHKAARMTVQRLALPQGRSTAARMAELQENGFLDVSFLTQVIDLSLGVDRLWSDVRSSYRPLIKRGRRELALAVYDRDRPPGAAFDSYQRLHAAAAGRVTRPRRTFDLMRSWIESGQGILVEAALADRAVGYALILCAKSGAYYGSGCCAPDVDLPHLMHTLQWEAISALAARGFSWYEVGHQHLRPTLTHPAEPKVRSISFFKRGLGGTPRICVVGECYDDDNLFRAVTARRLDEFLAARTLDTDNRGS